jgi:hypothetical protein
MHATPESEHPYTAMLRRHKAHIAAGLISPYGQAPRKVLTKAEREATEHDNEAEQSDDN